MTGERAPSPHETTAAANGTAPADAAPATAGQMLRQARERAGLHLAALAAVLKVPPQRLEALEADRYDQLPGMAFVRGLAASLARTLKLDASEVLALLPKTEASTLKQDRVVASVSGSRSLPSHASGYGARPWITRVLVAVIVLLLLGAAAIVFLPQLRGGAGAEQEPDSGAAASQPLAGDASPEPAGATAGSDASGTAGDASLTLTTLAPAVPAVPAAADTANTASTAAGAVASAAPTPAVLPAAAGAVAPISADAAAQATASGGAGTVVNLAPQGIVATPTTGDVVFTAKGGTWVEVLDANKLPLLRRTLQAGEKVGISGAQPLSVVVGSVQNVDVEVRGQPYPLGRFQRGNVARFQVK